MNIAISGTLIDSPDPHHIRVRKDHAFMIDSTGNICWIGSRSELPKGVKIEEYADMLILPGLVDSHVHLAQYPFACIGQGNLLDWLNVYAFPTEAKFSNPEIARQVSRKFFFELLKRGTTTAAVHVTSSPQATDIAFEEALRSGIRVQMGQVHMDLNAPKDLILDERRGMESMVRLFEKWHNCENRLFYSVIPRFALSVSRSYMEKLGQFARRHQLTVQTHVAENQEEIHQVKFIHADALNYTDIYRQAALLGPKTLLAHGIYLSDDEVSTIVGHGANIVHCPSSNRYLASGFYPYRHRVKQGIKTVIGTDVGAGYTLNMLCEIRETLETDKAQCIMSAFNELSQCCHDEFKVDCKKTTNQSLVDNGNLQTKNLERHSSFKNPLFDPLSLSETFYAATRRPHKIFDRSLLGLFEESAPADFIVIEDSFADPFKDMGFYQDVISRLRRVIYCDQIVVKETWIQGRCLYRKPV